MHQSDIVRNNKGVSIQFSMTQDSTKYLWCRSFFRYTIVKIQTTTRGHAFLMMEGGREIKRTEECTYLDPWEGS